jgi:hypothetical protein
MTLTTRMILVLTLILIFAMPLAAQEEPSASATAAEAPVVTETVAGEESEAAGGLRSSYEVRNMFSRRVREQPQELARILALDPMLLSNDEFLAGYPAIARFVSQYPEVQRNPRFYLSEFSDLRRSSGGFEDFFEGLTVFAVFVLIAFVLAWLVRTVIEQKRWNRLSRTQSEVHNKILDRFGTSTELLEYIKTPAGTKFLESAPIPLHAERTPQNPSLTRIMWSIQIGVVVAAGALGMILVSMRFDGETSAGFFAMGAIGFCVGAGFIASAIVSIMLSRRLDNWRGSSELPASIGDSELMR